jgi:hypothetical protein
MGAKSRYFPNKGALNPRGFKLPPGLNDPTGPTSEELRAMDKAMSAHWASIIEATNFTAELRERPPQQQLGGLNSRIKLRKGLSPTLSSCLGDH